MKSVLVVDDVDDARQLVRAALEPLGHTIVEAAGGVEALEILDAGDEFGVMLLDIRMPDLSGFEVIEQMRERSHLSRVPVIMFSAHADRGTANRALEAGAVAYLEKPYRLGELVDLVGTHAV